VVCVMSDWGNRFSLCMNWLDDEHHRHNVLVGLLIMAFVLRLAAASIIPIDYRLQKDAVEYVSGARHLLTLGVFGEEAGVPYAIIPPGYPLFIAAVFALTGQSLMAVRLIQVVLGVLMVWLTSLVGREVASKRAGLGAAFICAMYPVWVIWPVLFLTETLYAILVLTFVWCLVRSMETCTIQYAAITGVAFGLTLLTREALLLFPLLLPFALWWFHVYWRRAWRYLLIFALATLLTLSPWLARNYHTFGQVFYTERTEKIRYQLTGSGYLAPRYEHLADENFTPPSKTASQERFGRTSDMLRIGHLLNHPTAYLRHLVNRFAEYWLHPNGLQSLPNYLIVRSVYVAAHIGMLGLAIIGMLSGLRRREAATGVFTLLLAYITGTNLFLTVPNPRYNLPFLPILFIFTAKGALTLIKQFAYREPLPAQSGKP